MDLLIRKFNIVSPLLIDLLFYFTNYFFQKLNFYRLFSLKFYVFLYKYFTVLTIIQIGMSNLFYSLRCCVFKQNTYQEQFINSKVLYQNQTVKMVTEVRNKLKLLLVSFLLFMYNYYFYLKKQVGVVQYYSIK